MLEAIKNLKSKLLSKAERPRGRLVRDYFLISVILIGGGLITSGLLEIYFRYRESRENVTLFQQEVAEAAAFKVEQFIDQIETALRTATKSPVIARKGLSDEFQSELTRLLLVTPAIEEVAALDLTGRIHLQASRFRAILPEDKEELPPRAAFETAKNGKSFIGPVYFARGSEPYNYITVPIERFAGDLLGILWAKVNLKYIWEVIQDIKVGKAGYAYIVTRSGDLVAHPDLSLVLGRKNLAQLAPVQAAFQSGSPVEKGQGINAESHQGSKVFASYMLIRSFDWAVIIEQPLGEAYAPLYASVFRTSSLLMIGLGMALLASIFVARRVVRPLELLRWGAERIGAGDLNHKLEIKTGDELEVLADEFNKMTSRLQESYSNLGQKVEDRTRELSDALEQQTATSEILRVIASSPTDVQPVFAAIARSAMRLCGGTFSIVSQYDGELMHLAAHEHVTTDGVKALQRITPLRPPDRRVLASRAILERAVVHVPDIQADPDYDQPLSEALRVRSGLAVPILRNGQSVGSISVGRFELRPFTDNEIALLQIFADQAVIAIENVRLFRELQERSRELARSVTELRALGAVSQAIGFSLDLETILTSIVTHAVNLSETDSGAVFEFDEQNQELSLRATYKLSDELVQAFEKFRTRLADTIVGRAVTRREPIQIFDILQEPDYPLRDILKRMGMRGVLVLPLIREGAVVGALVVGSKVPGQLSTTTVDLLHTLATQSVLAIQNARLFRNIQEQQEQLQIANERLREIDRLKSGFLSNVSHELRTPLTAIGGIAENLLDGMAGMLNEKQARYITGIKDSGDRLARLIDDLLDLSAIEANRIRLTPSSFPLDNLVYEVAEMLKSVAETKSVALEVPARNGHLMACADSDKITQVLTNLLINAVKFTPSGGKVALTLEPSIESNWLQVNVTDSGPGIPAAEAEKIFDEFYQISQPDRKKTEGVGLGLAICKRLVEMHGGAIWVDSTQGRGSSFHFTVPAAQITSHEPSAT
jgi:signal transduction histidine kinase